MYQDVSSPLPSGTHYWLFWCLYVMFILRAGTVCSIMCPHIQRPWIFLYKKANSWLCSLQHREYLAPQLLKLVRHLQLFSFMVPLFLPSLPWEIRCLAASSAPWSIGLEVWWATLGANSQVTSHLSVTCWTRTCHKMRKNETACISLEYFAIWCTLNFRLKWYEMIRNDQNLIQ